MYDLEKQKEENKRRKKEDINNGLTRKCGMCNEIKTIDNFKIKDRRYRRNGFYNAYCNNCQKFYMKEYMRIYRERKN